MILGPQLRAVKLPVAMMMKTLAAKNTVATPALAITPVSRRRPRMKISATMSLGA
ncbi:hypothetical protein [Pseudorhizobium marinum]|uniref:hypothetical protein n=1 Tax=Pseudorhizobium marinum TaxID=1496690 RepID=UPI000AFAAA75|nr:hypothetical protein [Pseudorhizobium marinum]